jgi:hypothetical protein
MITTYDYHLDFLYAFYKRCFLCRRLQRPLSWANVSRIRSLLLIQSSLFQFNVVLIHCHDSTCRSSFSLLSSSSSSFYYASISILSLPSYISSIPTRSPYSYYIIIITLQLLRRRDAACREEVVVDREARRLRSYESLDEGIHEEVEGKRKLWSKWRDLTGLSDVSESLAQASTKIQKFSKFSKPSIFSILPWIFIDFTLDFSLHHRFDPSFIAFPSRFHCYYLIFHYHRLVFTAYHYRSCFYRRCISLLQYYCYYIACIMHHTISIYMRSRRSSILRGDLLS